MKLRPLILDDKAKAAVQCLRDFAEKPANWYLIGPGGRSSFTPGDLPQYRVFLGSYRCVFTWTRQHDGRLFRHLSISVPSERYPNPIVAFEIAKLFGFTGRESPLVEAPDGVLSVQHVDTRSAVEKAAAAGWLLNISKEDRCIVIAQEIPRESETASLASLDSPIVA